MAYAVETADSCYYLTVDGSWFGENRSWDDYTPEGGDTVAVTGVVSEHADVHGDLFLCVEVESVRPLAG